MAAERVSREQRYTRDRPCHICGGWDSAARGQGTRCHGFLAPDGRYARCSREDNAGLLALEGATGCYVHRLDSDCPCGVRHHPGPTGGPAASHRRIVQSYDYRDEPGTLLYQTVRYQPKDFRQRRPRVADPQSERGEDWDWNLEGVRRVLYRLPQLRAADPVAWVFAVEGEKDADALAALDLVAISNVGGAGKWKIEYNEALRGRLVAILPDNDAAGQAHAETVAQALAGTAAEVRLVALPGLPMKGDVSAWLGAGGTAEALRALVDATPPAESAKRANRENLPKREKRAFTLTALGDLLSEPEEAIAWTVDGLLPTGGVSLVVAKPKVGKSTLARNIALAIARGEPILDRATQQGPIIYLALEEKRQQVADHFRKMGADATAPILIHVGSAPDKALTAPNTPDQRSFSSQSSRKMGESMNERERPKARRDRKNRIRAEQILGMQTGQNDAPSPTPFDTRKNLYALLDAPNLAARGLPGCVLTEYKRCGKSRCRCATGQLHGPYHYWNGRILGTTWKKYLTRADAPRIAALCRLHRDRRRAIPSVRQSIRFLNRAWRDLDRLAGW